MTTKILSSTNNGFESECKQIHDSWGNLNQLVQVLASRTKHERRQIKETYKEMYGEELVDLMQRMVSQRDNQAKIALSMFMLDPHERDAMVARKALEDTNYKALVEIFLGRKSSHIVLIKQAYQARFRRQLDQDILNIEPPHSYQKILVALSASHKAHQADVSQHIAKCDARRLYETGEGSSGSTIEENIVLEILSKRSIPQLKLAFCCYKHIYGHDYTKSLKNRNSIEFSDSLRMVVKCICNPPNYYAKALYGSIKGITATDKDALVRVIVSRTGCVDMEEIQRDFKKKFGVELRDAICENIPSGDYRDLLVALATKASTSIRASAITSEFL
ncbi:putative Annexin 8 [Tripterygium wilfordii]|uniref:Putative Annexin 8 n=1 Tax=Tripterygium wilfordii TaxID=458696 RepID=A0A7J7CM63_TRIWF|nr:annexin D8-like [Tripterygium wilfordii]KAF5735162.1 putative Annexin 8 [Tripterygium wilfordii]